MEHIIIPDLKSELDTGDYIYTKNKKGDVESLGFKLNNLFMNHDIPILEKNTDYVLPVGIHLFIPNEENDIDSEIREEENVIDDDIYEKLLSLHKKNMLATSKKKKNNNTKKKKLKKTHSRGTRKNLK